MTLVDIVIILVIVSVSFFAGWLFNSVIGKKSLAVANKKAETILRDAEADVDNLKKGKKMAGRMGGVRVTTKHHRLVSIDKENNLLIVEGAIAGPDGGYVEVCDSKTAKMKK